MPSINSFSILILIALHFSPVAAFGQGSVSNAGGASAVVPNFMSYEFPLLNLMKTQAQAWSKNPAAVDNNGYPLPGTASVTSNVLIPSSFVLSSHYVLTTTGHGTIGTSVGATNTLVSCSGARSGNICNNAGCSGFTASIAGKTLTVTAAPTGTGCTLTAGLPISGTGVTANKWGVPVFISGSSLVNPSSCSPSCTGAGGTGTYALNSFLTVGSEVMTMGIRYEFSFSNVDNDSGNSSGLMNLQVSITASQIGDPIQNISLVPYGEEQNYWNSVLPCGSGQACIIGSAFRTRVRQGGWSVMRDLNFLYANVNTCTTWASRTPINYYAYNNGELRNAAAGTMTYSVAGHSYTIPNPGQFVNSSGTGASGGTVSYNAGTDTYAVTLNTGNFVDKQTFEVLIPTTGTTRSKISMNGNTAVPILNYSGGSGVYAPASGELITFIYDQDLGGAIYTLNSTHGANNGIYCGMPPEVFIELCAELNITPWHVLPYLALDPMTDWVEQFATYLQTNYTPPHSAAIAGPIYEVQNEAFNCTTISPEYLSNKSQAHVRADTNHAWTSSGVPNCGAGNNASEIGKMASTVGQDLRSIYGVAVEIVVPEQTGGSLLQWADTLPSAAYIGQSMAVQTGFSQVPAYTVATRLSVANYWGTGYNNSQNAVEVGFAYCYFYYSQSAGCQAIYASQQAAMDAKMNSSLTSGLSPVTNIPVMVSQIAIWKAFGKTCSQVSRPANCTINPTAPLMMYEGGFAEGAQVGDMTQAATAVTNASTAILTVPGNGCVPGQTVALSNLSGGTWSGVAGSYVVQSSGTDASHCAINLNSTGLGKIGAASFTARSGGAGNLTLTVTGVTGFVTVGMKLNVGAGIGVATTIASQISGTTGGAGTYTTNIATFANGTVSGGPTLTYTGSSNYVNYLRRSTYLQTSLYTLTTTVFNDIIANGGINPSQFNLASSFGGDAQKGGGAWYVDSPSNYLTPGYPLANCTGCTIAGPTLMLGGTITGIFAPGMVLTGNGGVASNSLITSCTKVGTGPCGSNSGDTLGLSQSSTVSSGNSMTGSIPPKTITGPPATISPITAFRAICDWNQNDAMCH